MDIAAQFKSKTGNILVLTCWSYSDALIQTYTLPYLRIIRKLIPPQRRIYLVTLEKKNTRKSHAVLSDEKSIVVVPCRYHPFGWKGFISWIQNGSRLIQLIWKERVNVIHCWGTPAGGIGYVLSKLTGQTLILDSYEPHAEAMVESGTWPGNGIAFRLLFWLEKKQTRRAAQVVGTTDGMRQYARIKYGVQIQHFFSKPAGVDLSLFSLSEIKRKDLLASLGIGTNDVVCVYAGKFGDLYLEQEVFDFFAVSQAFWQHRFKVLLLTNSSQAQIDSYCRKSGLDSRNVIVRFVPHREVPSYLGCGDFAITTIKPVPSKRYCTPIKNGEYWALGLPIVISAGISDDSEIIEELQIGAVLHQWNQKTYYEAVQKIDKLIRRPDLRIVIRELASERRNFEQATQIYEKIYLNAL